MEYLMCFYTTFQQTIPDFITTRFKMVTVTILEDPKMVTNKY